MNNQLAKIQNINNQIEQNHLNITKLKELLNEELKTLQAICPHAKYKELCYAVGTIKYCAVCQIKK